MLSNKSKLQLADKFNFMKVKSKSALKRENTSQYFDTAADTDADTDDTDDDTDDDTADDTAHDTDDDTAHDTVAKNELHYVVNHKYTHFADTLLKTLPKQRYDFIHVCVYRINKVELYPFVMFILYKDDNNYLNLPDLTGYVGSDLIAYVLTEFKNIFSDDKAEIEYKGFIEEADGIVVVLEYKDFVPTVVENKNIIEKGLYDNKWWWALASEIINNKLLLNFPISEFCTNFLIKHNKLSILSDKNGNVYETPEIGYYGNYYKKIAAVASLGLSRESPYTSFGPFYYFSNYTHAMRNAFWHNNNQSTKVGDEFITVDDKGLYKKGGLIRFALFVGKTKMLLGRANDIKDDSRISIELAKKKPLINYMLKLRDSGAKWIIEYNSIRIGQHHISFQDTDNKENIDFYTNPMIGLRDYQQQVPLEYYFVDTSQNIRKDNIDKAIIL